MTRDSWPVISNSKRAREELWVPAAALAVVALVSVAAAAGVHYACFHPPPPVTLPDPGTARGKYCSAVLPTHPWVSLTVAPVILTGATTWIVRRWPWLATAIVLLVSTALIVNAIIANDLNAAQTI